MAPPSRIQIRRNRRSRLTQGPTRYRKGESIERSTLSCYADAHRAPLPFIYDALIFERFQQVESTDRTQAGGAGFGLAICKLIVEEHGGEIGIDERPGGGSIFWFTLPEQR
ncbi:MAG: hypothetical protein K2W95_06120 [Candidatus Obscuribacterales bacterium]|nr:hypothetical protein [Candidatus Obscuribacterales bacterium]